LYQSWRFGRAMNAPTSSNVCVACDSADVDEFAPGAYRCLTCGYEGGPGHADYMAERKRQKLAALDEPARRKRAAKLLEDAHYLLLSGHGTLHSAKHSGWLDLAGVGGGGYSGTAGEGWEKQQEFVSAVGDVLTAQAEMEEAAELLGITYPEHLRFKEELGFAGASFDRAFDNMYSDFAFIEKAARSLRTVEAMQRWCEMQRVT
jgi:hypothetical protein